MNNVKKIEKCAENLGTNISRNAEVIIFNFDICKAENI